MRGFILCSSRRYPNSGWGPATGDGGYSRVEAGRHGGRAGHRAAELSVACRAERSRSIEPQARATTGACACVRVRVRARVALFGPLQQAGADSRRRLLLHWAECRANTFIGTVPCSSILRQLTSHGSYGFSSVLAVRAKAQFIRDFQVQDANCHSFFVMNVLVPDPASASRALRLQHAAGEAGRREGEGA